MSELAYAAKLFRNLPPNGIIHYPSGRWGFVGSVDARLAYESNDGNPATEEELENARSFGPRVAGVKTRTWATKEEAEKAAADLGLEVSYPVKPEKRGA